MATTPSQESFASPNAIPPRTSSHGVVSGSISGPAKLVHVLRPKPEAEWIARPKTVGTGSHSRSASAEEKRAQYLNLDGMAVMAGPSNGEHAESSASLQQGNNIGEKEKSHSTASQRQTQQQQTQSPDPPAESARRSPVDSLPTWTPQKESVLLAPYTYLENHPGKDIRSQLIHAFDAWLQVPPTSLSVITRVVGMLHTSSLLIDDVEDSSLLRRGVPVAHSIFGTAQTINSANYVYFLALQELTKLQNAECNRIFVDELLNLHRGQGMDLFWRDTLTCPSEADYLEMVGNKTGGLFRLAVKLMMAESSLGRPSHDGQGITTSSRNNSVPDCVPLVSTIGLLFQVLDDYLNLQSTAYTERKGLCEDLTEGKFSFPVIHAIRSASEAALHQQQQHASKLNGLTNGLTNGHPNGHHHLHHHQPSYPSAISQPPPYTNNILLNILSQRTRDDEVKRYAVRYMEQCGSFAYTRSVIADLHAEAEKLVSEVAAKVGGEAGEKGMAGLRKILEVLRAE